LPANPVDSRQHTAPNSGVGNAGLSANLFDLDSVSAEDDIDCFSLFGSKRLERFLDILQELSLLSEVFSVEEVLLGSWGPILDEARAFHSLCCQPSAPLSVAVQVDSTAEHGVPKEAQGLLFVIEMVL
jgi:hypothetical protein